MINQLNHKTSSQVGKHDYDYLHCVSLILTGQEELVHLSLIIRHDYLNYISLILFGPKTIILIS